MKTVRVYLASQIFAECWRDFNEKLAKEIEEALPEIELYVPQRNKAINDKTKCASAEDIATGDFTNNLDHDDIVVAVVDGDTPGIGTTLEIGYFARMCQEEYIYNGFTNKRIIAINVQGLTGKKKDYTSIPYSKICTFSVETAGFFDLDSELELYMSGVGHVKFQFTQGTDIKEICRAISRYTLV